MYKFQIINKNIVICLFDINFLHTAAANKKNMLCKSFLFYLVEKGLHVALLALHMLISLLCADKNDRFFIYFNAVFWSLSSLSIYATSIFSLETFSDTAT